jgi:hypothetical protein
MPRRAALAHDESTPPWDDGLTDSSMGYGVESAIGDALVGHDDDVAESLDSYDDLVALAGGEERTTEEVVAALDATTAAVNQLQRERFRAIVACQLHRVWMQDDCRDFPHWLSLHLGITTYKARRWVACAWALDRLPVVEAAFVSGRLSVDEVVELTRLAGAVDESESRLLSWAMRVSIASIRERADEAIRIAREDTQEAERQRSVKWWWEMDRAYVNLYARLPADMGIRVTTALDRIASRLPASPEDYAQDDDAALEDDDRLEARRADALDLLAGRSIAEDRDADRATVVIHAPLSALVSGETNGVSSRGEVLAPEVVSRLCCDSRLQTVIHGESGGVIGIGMTSRLIPKWLRREVEHRDGFRCTFPNCGSRLGTDAHHVVQWPHGPTDVDNLTLICRTHHRLVHEHHWHVMLAKDQSARWFRADWTPYEPGPPAREGPAARRGRTRDRRGCKDSVSAPHHVRQQPHEQDMEFRVTRDTRKVMAPGGSPVACPDGSTSSTGMSFVWAGTPKGGGIPTSSSGVVTDTRHRSGRDDGRRLSGGDGDRLRVGRSLGRQNMGGSV